MSMAGRGSYLVNPKPKENYLAFICSLLVFLGLLVFIFCMTYFLQKSDAAPRELSSAKEEELKRNAIKKDNFSNVAFISATRYPADAKEGILDKNQTEEPGVDKDKDKRTHVVKDVNIALHVHENKSVPLDDTKKKQINNSSNSVENVNQYIPMDENEVKLTNVSSETNDIKNEDLFFNKTKDKQSNFSSGSDAKENIKLISSGVDVNLNVISPVDQDKQTNFTSDTNEVETVNGPTNTSSGSDTDEDKQTNTSDTNEEETVYRPTNTSSEINEVKHKDLLIYDTRDGYTNTSSDINDTENKDLSENDITNQELSVDENGDKQTNTSSGRARVENEDSLLHENKDKITNTTSEDVANINVNKDKETETNISSDAVGHENNDKLTNTYSGEIGDINKDVYVNGSVFENGNKFKQNNITYETVGDVNVILRVNGTKIEQQNASYSVGYKNQSSPVDENNGEQTNNSTEAVKDTNNNSTLDGNNDKTNVSSSENRDKDLLDNKNEHEQTNTTSDIVGDVNSILTITGNKGNQDNSSSDSFEQESKFANNQANSSFDILERRSNGLLVSNSSNTGLPLDENNDTDTDSRRSLFVNETAIISSDLFVENNTSPTTFSSDTAADTAESLSTKTDNETQPDLGEVSVVNSATTTNPLDTTQDANETLSTININNNTTGYFSSIANGLYSLQTNYNKYWYVSSTEMGNKDKEETPSTTGIPEYLNTTTTENTDSPTTTNPLDTTKDANETLSTTNINNNTTGYFSSMANGLYSLQKNYNKYWYVNSTEIGNKDTEETPSTTGIPEYVNTTTSEATENTSTITLITKNINLQTSLQQIPRSCESFLCKNLASSMLARMNHSISPCEDFYQFACGGNHLREDNFRENIFDNIIADNYKGAPEIFITFITSCKIYDSDFNFVERKESVIEPDVNSFEIEDLIVEMVHLQTMYFFDISVTFGENSELTFLVTPIKHEILKTTLTGWSMVDHFRDRCFEKHTRQLTIDATSEQIQKSNNDTNICLIIEIRRYLEGYATENNIDESQVDKLIHLLNNHLKHTSSASSDPLTIKEFIDEYEQLWNVNWKRIFKKLHNNKSLHPDSQIIVQNDEDLKGVFAQFGKISNASKLLSLWHNVQLYHNIVMNRQENNDYYCLNLAFELMPDVATYLVYSRYMTDEKARNEVSYIYEILDKMKHNKNRVFSGVQMDMNSFKIRTLTDSFDFDIDRTNYISLKLNESDFSTNFKNLLRNYRSQLFNFINETIDTNIILKYFIDVFESKPKMIEPLKEIVYHPRFLELASTDAPKFIPNARIGYSLAEEILNSYWYDGDDIFENDNIVDYGLEPMQEEYIHIIAENAAYKLFTDFYEKTKPTYTETIVFASPTYSIQQMFLIFAAQDYCKKGIKEEKVFDVAVPIPARMKIRNTAKNSQFFYKTFNCPENGVYWPNIEPRMPLTSN